MAKYHERKTPASRAFTDLIRAALRMTPQSLRIGPLLTGDVNLSNTRWQALGELNDVDDPLTVSQMARRMGLTRQSVQRLMDGMAEAGFVKFVENPADQRAMLVALTKKGRATYAKTQEREWRWTNAVAAHFDAEEMRRAAELIERVTDRMQDEM